MMPKILLVSNFFPPEVVGGAEVVAHRQARILIERGFDVAVFAGGMPSERFAAGSFRIETSGLVPVYRVSHISLGPNENFDRPEIGRLFSAVLANFAPDVVHFHNIMGLGANLILHVHERGAKTLVTLHDHWGVCFKSTRLRNDMSPCGNVEECATCQPFILASDDFAVPMRLRRDFIGYCLSKSSRLISPSQYLADAYSDSTCLTKEIDILSNGIDLDRITLSSKRKEIEPVRFLCLSYLGKHKGITHLLEAAERLAKSTSMIGRWKLTIAGKGELSSEIEDGIRSGRFGDAVEFVGALDRDAALNLLSRSDALVLSSVWPENEPVSLLEAIASGVAQIATRIGGNVHLVEDGQSGLLVPPADSDALADAMERMVQSPEMVDRFKRYNADRRDQYCEIKTVDKLMAMYQSQSVDPDPLWEELVVLCAGRTADATLDQLLHVFWTVEDAGWRVRFIWHEWADSSVWRDAKLIWFWGHEGPEELALVSRALRSGVPLLSRDGGPLAGISHATGGETFGTFSEAGGLIAARASRERPDVCPASKVDAVSRIVTAAMPGFAFKLAAERVS